jgi:hypothetical protein
VAIDRVAERLGIDPEDAMLMAVESAALNLLRHDLSSSERDTAPTCNSRSAFGLPRGGMVAAGAGRPGSSR